MDLDFEVELKETLARYLSQSDGRTPPNLAESIQYSLMAPGKRIRPRLLLACAKMVGFHPKEVLPAALALEMIHCFTLIHDDLPCMDDDDFRRGMPSNHKKFGESIALLAGDALIPLAMEIFLDSQIPSSHLMVGLKRLLWASGPRGVIGGQAAESLLSATSKLESLQLMHQQKTGALFSAALLIPKDFAGISDVSPEGHSIVTFAFELGLAFQVADDLEDQMEASQFNSVLHYLSAQEASRMTLEKLNEASQSLQSHWGEKAWELLQIGDEVKKKILQASEGQKK